MGYLRLMQRQSDTVHTTNEQTALLLLLTNCPGVTAVKIDGVHPKGGYRVDCAISEEAFENVIKELEAHGWMSAI